MLTSSFKQKIMRGTDSSRFRGKKGYTLTEIIIIVAVIGILGGAAVWGINGLRESGTDSTKIRNADQLNAYMTAIHNGGVDTTVWADGAAAIAALEAGVTIPGVGGAAAQTVILRKNLNPAAYTYTAGSATVAPSFTPNLGAPTVDP